MNRNTRLTQTFIGAMVLAAIASSAYASVASHALHAPHALAILALAAATSRMKIKLPGINGNMSVNLPFLLMAVVNLSALEAVVIASLSTVVQCWPKLDARFKPEQMLFNVLDNAALPLELRGVPRPTRALRCHRQPASSTGPGAAPCA